MFVIHGLSKYAQVFKRLDVVQQALDCFRAWDAEAHDPITGALNIELAETVWCLSGSEAVKNMVLDV